MTRLNFAARRKYATIQIESAIYDTLYNLEAQTGDISHRCEKPQTEQRLPMNYDMVCVTRNRAYVIFGRRTHRRVVTRASVEPILRGARISVSYNLIKRPWVSGLLRLQQIYQGLKPGNESFQVETVKRIQNMSEAIDFLRSLEELNR